MPIVEAVGRAHVRLNEALRRVAAEKLRQPVESAAVEHRITRVQVVKKRADGTVIEEVEVGDDR
jgi:hypothetical protein